eukprot:CAMPEP_0202728182 /NCGR_PEP_ID=MMETSP1385-20130828/185497_1 /ASSEMBLY_ACC=CAM_ASM_000861 /TAXON_ID=933848 /ORGANISM="Elphidium margaritaceum" /LENGTH=529 /DNA_ID=CAMNT_0049394429 /DNA_START=63 /DNA_END=1653 /DNA_ORIENTATION=-
MAQGMQMQMQNPMQAQNQNQQSQGPLIDSKSLITTSKGWDLRIFRDEQLARRFLCALCGNVCRNAHELSCSNAHLFCEQCINDYSNNSNTTACPIDHELNCTHQSSRFVSRHIGELYVYCPRSKVVCSRLMKYARFNNNQLFCPFEGTLGTLVDHCNHHCIFNVIACPFHLIGCPTNKMYRYELQNHIHSAQNKHISLSLQKIQTLQQSLKQKEDSNEIYQEQLRALKIASKSKDESIEKLSFENEKDPNAAAIIEAKEDSNEIYQEQLRALKIASKSKDESIEKLSFENEKLNLNTANLAHECTRLKDELKHAQQRMMTYSKAVNMLKENNSKLAEQVDDLNVSQQQMTEQYQQQQQHQHHMGGGGGGGGLGMMNASSLSSMSGDVNGNNGGGNNENENQTELSNQFSALLSMQRSNVDHYHKNSDMLNKMSSSATGSDAAGAAAEAAAGLDSINNADDRTPNSTDVVCAFLKDHPEIVSKLKNSNQIMYANIITDDKYAAQFLKKMLQSGNEDYRNEISQIVTRLQN